MTDVWIVGAQDYEEQLSWWLEGIFASEQEAEAFAQAKCGDSYIWFVACLPIGDVDCFNPFRLKDYQCGHTVEVGN